MEENKTEEYTFRVDEKEILNILGSFEKELEKENKNANTEIRYYNNFTFNGKSIEGLENMFITIEKDENGKTIGYNIYTPDMRKILSTDSKGNITECLEELEQVLGKIDVKKLIEENEIIDDEKATSRLKGKSEKAEPEEMKKALKGEDEKEKDEQGNDEETQKVEEALQEQGENLEISKYRKIKDSHISERMPEVFRDGEENGIAFSNKLNRFVIISKVNGEYQLNENVEPARMTWKSIISIDATGEKVERKVPHALMEIPNNDEKEIAVTLDYYGDVEIETVDVLPCQERIARQVREEGEGLESEETRETRNYFEKSGKENKHDLAHKVKEIEEAQKDANQTVENDITPDDYIPNTRTTWRELMEDTGESLPELIDRYNREIVKEGVTSEDVIDTIEYDYGNVNREHNH